MIQDVFRAEVQRPADPNSAARRPPTSVEWESNRQLNAAVIDGHLDQLRILLVEKGLDPNARDEHGNTVGHQVIQDTLRCKFENNAAMYFWYNGWLRLGLHRSVRPHLSSTSVLSQLFDTNATANSGTGHADEHDTQVS